MNASEKLKKIIEVILEKQPVKQASAKLIDGTEIQFEILEVNQPINVVTSEGVMSLNSGTYELEDGTKIEVVDGVIKSIEKPQAQAQVSQADEVLKSFEEKLNALEGKLAKFEEAMLKVAQAADEKIEKVEQRINELPAAKKTQAEKEQVKQGKKSIYDYIK
jgi:exonuclease VII small subunit